jgi:hypothetical protein
MRHHLPWTAAALASTLVISAAPWAAQPAPAPIAAGTLKRIASVDERFQSYNVEMAEVIGGNFWKPYSPQDRTAPPPTSPTEGAPAAAPPRPAGVDPSMFQARPPIDLGNRRLRTLAAALGPAYMRTSGSWANTVYFHDADTPAPDAPPKGFRGVLTRAQWKGVVDFSRAVNAKLVSSFTISEGVRDASGVWTPDQARRLLAFTKAAGGEMYAAEFFNEPDIPSFGGAPAGYTAADFARDFAVFRAFVTREAPALKIAGPGSVGEAVLLPATGRAETATGLLSTADMLTATPRPAFDILSYHFYGAVSRRCGGVGGGGQTSADAALSEDWLALADREYAFYRAVRDRLDRSLPIWVTETGESACGGNPWASTFLDTFRYLDQMARLARRGVAATFHNTLAASDYALLDDRNGFTPRPSYWAALLWHRLMGPTVLDAGVHPALHLYAQCLAGRPGGVTLLAINTNRTEPQSIDLSNAADRYTLSASPLESQIVQVNGRDVSLQGNDALPELAPARVAPGRLTLAPATITFLAIGDAGNAACGGK